MHGIVDYDTHGIAEHGMMVDAESLVPIVQPAGMMRLYQNSTPGLLSKPPWASISYMKNTPELLGPQGPS